ncbi:MAG: hypothetical protein QM780_04610 [Hyphomicrobium sp.]|uniref:hypothetical protein n=1 Tax=Hyphomicrobium sp. TaxID=82 RepID=UPI0039E446AA
MNAHERLADDMAALRVIEQLHDALQFAESELQRRCVISSKVRDAVNAAEWYLTCVQRRTQ